MRKISDEQTYLLMRLVEEGPMPLSSVYSPTARALVRLGLARMIGEEVAHTKKGFWAYRSSEEGL